MTNVLLSGYDADPEKVLEILDDISDDVEEKKSHVIGVENTWDIEAEEPVKYNISIDLALDRDSKMAERFYDEFTTESPSIYLAGPIACADDPCWWRDELKEEYPDIDWIDPMEWQDEWDDDPSTMWETDLDSARNNPVLVCNIGSRGPNTAGTHHEIREALNNDQDVAIVPNGTVSPVYRDVEPVKICSSRSEAVDWLTREYDRY